MKGNGDFGTVSRYCRKITVSSGKNSVRFNALRLLWWRTRLVSGRLTVKRLVSEKRACSETADIRRRSLRRDGRYRKRELAVRRPASEEGAFGEEAGTGRGSLRRDGRYRKRELTAKMSLPEKDNRKRRRKREQHGNFKDRAFI